MSPYSCRSQRRFNIDVLTRHEVTTVDAASKTVSIKNLSTDVTMVQHFDALVLATGAASIVPQLPGIVEKDGVPKYVNSLLGCT